MDAGLTPGGLREGAGHFDPDSPLFIPEFAVIDDASARPIAADTPYTVHLIERDGTEIPGSDFSAYEINGMRSVPDGTRIEVLPIQGEWGFLWRRPFIDVDDWCVVKQASPGTAFNKWPLGVVFGAGGGAPTSDEWMLVHLALSTPVRTGSRVLALWDHAIEHVLNDVFDCVHLYPYLTWVVDYVTDDFVPTTLTWTQAQALAYAGGETAEERQDIGPWTHNQPGTNAAVTCCDTALVNGAAIGDEWDAETLVYGFRLRLTDLGLVVNGSVNNMPTITSGSAEFTLDGDQFAFVY